MSSERVLEEEEYLDRLSSIIERDYFPDIKKLRIEAEFLNELNFRGATRSPACSLRDRLNYLDSQQLSADCNDELVKSANNSNFNALDDFTSSLAIFQACHTSEDNASFRGLLDEAFLRRRIRMAWMYNKDPKYSRLEINNESMDVTESLENNVKSCNEKEETSLPIWKLISNARESRPAAVETWTHNPQNALMFTPDAINKTNEATIHHKSSFSIENNCSKQKTNEVSQSNNNNLMLPPKLLARCPNKKATRFNTNTPVLGALIIAEASEVPHEKASVSGNHSSISDGISSIQQKDLMRSTEEFKSGYNSELGPSLSGSDFDVLPMTPTPLFSDIAPLMTWGTLEASPVQLESDQTPRSYRVPDTPYRDELLGRISMASSPALFSGKQSNGSVCGSTRSYKSSNLRSVGSRRSNSSRSSISRRNLTTKIEINSSRPKDSNIAVDSMLRASYQKHKNTNYNTNKRRAMRVEEWGNRTQESLMTSFNFTPLSTNKQQGLEFN